MRDANWQQAKEIFNNALRYSPEEREQFLNEACRDNISLRIDVESLLISLTEGSRFLEQPVVGSFDQASVAWRLESGQKISHYEVRSPIAVGGMGEVYLAHDQNLHRDVALKILSNQVFADRERLLRFQREAAVVSALNHPNILTVFEFGECDGIDFLACEFVDGETLRDRLNRGPIDVAEALAITEQILSALHAAHKAGVIHRDIKPENVMIRSDGYVKILDFGLAKRTGHEILETPGNFNSLSTPGVIMGTVKYMSPEQTRGHSIDERSDLFSTAVVLYEMLTGRPPFTGEVTTDVIAAIIQLEPPPVSSIDPLVPPEVDSIVARGLEKSVQDRYATAGEMLVDLRRAKKHADRSGEYLITEPGGLHRRTGGTGKTSAQNPAGLGPVGRKVQLFILAAVLLTAAAFIYWYLLSPSR